MEEKKAEEKEEETDSFADSYTETEQANTSELLSQDSIILVRSDASALVRHQNDVNSF